MTKKQMIQIVIDEYLFVNKLLDKIYKEGEQWQGQAHEYRVQSARLRGVLDKLEVPRTSY